MNSPLEQRERGREKERWKHTKLYVGFLIHIKASSKMCLQLQVKVKLFCSISLQRTVPDIRQQDNRSESIAS